MEAIKPKDFFGERTIEEINELINTKALTGILMIPIKKAKISKKEGISMQSAYAINNAQKYAMYMNYIDGKEGREMRVIESKTNKNGKLFIHGYCTENGKRYNMVVTYNLINKNGNINYAEIFKK
jgi:hypothetical protein